MPTRHSRKPDQSRRNFLRHAVAGAGATAAAVVAPRAAEASQQGSQNSPAAPAPAVAPIRVPPEFAAATAAAPVTFEFPMTGAQVFARACKEEGVAALFACPGNYGIIHALASAGIPAYGGRHEGSMAHAADAFDFSIQHGFSALILWRRHFNRIIRRQV